ncbi:hypothetical protein [Hoeflea olei]|uniref:Uncharacterized protein n=1 Tax=Hoeflea olei TaxID=1480615 RepID=A0A1C1YTY6_9HYPH|nr:hypothetical protein [Hoeflea olei]OCW57008.1 hypothetical protein AWJ14_07585 [Hoeflea olei]
MNDVNGKMTDAEVAGFVREFERRTGVFVQRVRGTAVWQLIRFEVAVRIQGLSLERAPVGRGRVLGSLVRGFVRFFGLKRAPYLCKTFDSAYRRETPDGVDDIYFDDLKPVMPGMVKMSSCDAVGYEQRMARASTPPVFDDTAVIALSAILGRVLPVAVRSPAFDAISRAIGGELGFGDYTPARIRRVYNVFWWRVLLYRLVLWRVRPKAVLCPDNGQFGLMRAAAQAGIPYIEMQHGVFTHAHPNALPPDLSAAEATGLLVPTVFAVYGAFSADVLQASWLHLNDRVRPVGAPFLERARAERAAHFRPGGVPRLTLSTQGIARQALGDFIASFLQLCEATFELVIKLHPAYDGDQDFYAQRFGKDPRVVIEPGTSAIGTDTLIARSDLHISISSACHYDALGIGTPTGILALETHEAMADLLGVPGACLIATPADLAGLVRNRAFGVVPEQTSRYFFERDFPGRVEALLESLGAAPDAPDKDTVAA